MEERLGEGGMSPEILCGRAPRGERKGGLLARECGGQRIEEVMGPAMTELEVSQGTALIEHPLLLVADCRAAPAAAEDRLVSAPGVVDRDALPGRHQLTIDAEVPGELEVEVALAVAGLRLQPGLVAGLDVAEILE